VPRHVLEIVIQNACREQGLPENQQFIRWAHTALGPETRGEVTIRIVDPAESRSLNCAYRGKDKATNVLAFPAGGVTAGVGDEELLPFGDLVICAAVVRAEAANRQIPEHAHWAHMVIHGCLHLLGCDHQIASEARSMEAMESQLLAGLGYADPYAAL
jgi:probable rRNA maturation factor